MNAVEIEDAISTLAAQPFDAAEFPFAFLAAFGNKATTIKRLRESNTNKSDIPGGVLQRKNIHIAVSEAGQVTTTLKALRESPETVKAKTKFILATDGDTLEAEDLTSGETLVSPYPDFADHFGFFLPLAGISTVKEIKENPIDVRATGRLNKLYVELLKENKDWAGAERRHDMNHFMARLIFCFFAEDTGIFNGSGIFTQTIGQMSAHDGSNVHEVMGTLFRAMDIKPADRKDANLPRWAAWCPYVNGSLFAGATDVPRFTKLTRSYLIHAGELDWKAINPDIFGSMIQAVADEEERGALGMHYTSVPNILKVLKPLFLDDLHTQLEAAGDNKVKLLNLRKRMARIRVFDPACGSGNFLVIAYKQMREIEAEVNRRRGEPELKSEIPLTNFRGIELRDFAAEIARLALVVAEYQCDVLYRGQKEAIKDVLPLKRDNWITCGNALRLDWLSICPPTGTGVKLNANDLFEKPLDQAEIDFENEGGETYICGNPPYKGRNKKAATEKAETKEVFSNYPGSFASVDYVANWIIKAAEYSTATQAAIGLVATNSVCQGEQVALLWPLVFRLGLSIAFAHTSFKWSNLASDKAGVTVVILGLARAPRLKATLYSGDEAQVLEVIGPYLVPNNTTIVEKRDAPIADVDMMYLGNMAKDGGNLIMSLDEARELIGRHDVDPKYVRKFFGSEELIHGKQRACLWIDQAHADDVQSCREIAERVSRVRSFRLASKAPSTREFAEIPYRFAQLSAASGNVATVVPAISSESRSYLPVDYLPAGPVVSHKCYALYDAPLWNFALIASKLHIVWIGTVCSRLEMRFSYGNKLGWNTFPVPTLTEQNKADLTRCAEEILLAREHYFPATIADMYDPERMDSEFSRIREAHERNDEMLERIYVGRRFKNDTERLEKLFAMYTKMTAAKLTIGKKAARSRGRVAS